MLNIANAARVPVKAWLTGTQLQKQIIDACLYDEELFLDVIDATLHFSGGSSKSSLDESLATGGSVWRVASDGKSLQRKVETTVQQVADHAMTYQDTAGQELREAWNAAYGRDPDPSDAWDHAIKAVEAVLIPIVVPNQDKAQLGHVLGQLSRQGQLYKFVLPGGDDSHAADVLVSMLDKLWPNPDRHASGNRRSPTMKEAQAALHLALTIVQWGRDGALARR